MTTLLALDTATEACSVALLHAGKVISHYEVIPRLHAQRLLPMIQTLLAEAGITLSAVDALAFGRGPGAFTGVRIAVGVVQGLAFALQRPVLPVSTLATIAQRAHREHGAEQVAVAVDARMDDRILQRVASRGILQSLTNEELELDRRIAQLQSLRDNLDGCIGCGCLSLKTCKLYNPDDVAAEGGPGPRVLR